MANPVCGESGVFLAKWKLAQIILLLKSMDMDKMMHKSFSPVRQLAVISKLAERTVQTQLLEFLERMEQLSPDHHAYWKNLSTITALIEMMDMNAKAADENKIAANMSIDQSATFDCVKHNILLRKLNYYSMDDTVLRWIQSYLGHRSGYVAIGTAISVITTQRCATRYVTRKDRTTS